MRGSRMKSRLILNNLDFGDERKKLAQESDKNTNFNLSLLTGEGLSRPFG